MKNKNIALAAGAVVIIASIALLSVSWYRFTDFFKRCSQIEIGMSEAEVEAIMQPYLNNRKYYVSRQGSLWGTGIYISSNATGNGCAFSIKDGKVDKTDVHFE